MREASPLLIGWVVCVGSGVVAGREESGGLRSELQAESTGPRTGGRVRSRRESQASEGGKFIVPSPFVVVVVLVVIVTPRPQRKEAPEGWPLYMTTQ